MAAWLDVNLIAPAQWRCLFELGVARQHFLPPGKYERANEDVVEETKPRAL